MSVGLNMVSLVDLRHPIGFRGLPWMIQKHAASMSATDVGGREWSLDALSSMMKTITYGLSLDPGTHRRVQQDCCRNHEGQQSHFRPTDTR